MQKQIQRFHLLGRGDETTCIVISYQFRHSIKNLPSSAARGKNPPIPNEPNEGKARYDIVCSDPKGKFSERILSVWYCTDGNVVFRCDSDKNSLVIISMF